MVGTLEDALLRKSLDDPATSQIDRKIVGHQGAQITVPAELLTQPVALRRVAAVLQALAYELNDLSGQHARTPRSIGLDARWCIQRAHADIKRMTGKGKKV